MVTVRLFALSAPARLALARRLKVLREAGVVRNVPKGRGRLLRLRRDELDAAFPGLLDSVLGAESAQASTR